MLSKPTISTLTIIPTKHFSMRHAFLEVCNMDVNTAPKTNPPKCFGFLSTQALISTLELAHKVPGPPPSYEVMATPERHRLQSHCIDPVNEAGPPHFQAKRERLLLLRHCDMVC